MAEYDKAIALALRLINKKGRLITVMKKRMEPNDSDEPWDVSEVHRDKFDTKAVEVPIESKYVDGTTVVMTDRQFYIPAASATFSVTMDCKIRDKGYDLQIVAINELAPGEQRVLYTVLAR